MDDLVLEDTMTDEEIQMRKEVAEEVYEGAAPVVDDIAVELAEDDDPQVVADEQVVPDEAAASEEVQTPDINQTLSAINSRLDGLSSIENRLKQTERRIGAVQNVLSETKKTVETAPSKEELADAAKSDEAWDELKTDFPEWATAIEGKIAASRTEMPDVTGLREDLTSVKDTMITGKNFEERLVGLMHPGWINTINSPEYKTWLAAQSAGIQAQHNNGATADDAVNVLNLFKESKNQVVSTKDTAASRKKRLKESVVPDTKHKTTPIKSEADMSEAELRQTIANEVWDE